VVVGALAPPAHRVMGNFPKAGGASAPSPHPMKTIDSKSGIVKDERAAQAPHPLIQ